MKMNFKIKNEYDYAKFKIENCCPNLKSSKKRNFIIKYFLKEDKHFTAEELYNLIKKKIPDIGFSTVYRTLNLLAKAGVASVRHFADENTLFEPIHKKEHHDHLICMGCGKIIEFTNKEIEKLQKNIARMHKFKVNDHKLEIYGFCLNCARRVRR